MLDFSLDTSGEDCIRSASEILTGLPAYLQRQVGHRDEDDLELSSRGQSASC